MNVRRISTLAIAVACLAVAFAACGGGDSSATAVATATPASATATPGPSGSTPNIDECALITAAELDQILPGQAFSSGKPRGDFCKFTGTADLVSIGTADLGTTAAAAQSLQDSANSTTSNKVEGVGDGAYWQPTNNQLAIVIGKIAMAVDVFAGSGDTSQSAEATAIARIALARLP
jgi:hypothetical protein